MMDESSPRLRTCCLTFSSTRALAVVPKRVNGGYHVFANKSNLTGTPARCDSAP